MMTDNDFLLPEWPVALQSADIVKARFILEFQSSCQVQPADFLGIGRSLALAARQLFDPYDAAAKLHWNALFQPPLSDDPVARRKFQKPSPAFVVTIPIAKQQLFEAGDCLDLEVLFIGTGIPLIHNFLSSLIHLGQLGLVAGEGCFEVTEVYCEESDCSANLVWRQHEPTESITCSVQPLIWLLQRERIKRSVMVKFITPIRLVVDGRPLRKPDFSQLFPFMLRRVTSMLYAHCGIEVFDDPTCMLEQAGKVNVVAAKLGWRDWRPLNSRPGLLVGGFVGEMTLQGQALEEIYWVLAFAALLGIGKGASCGGGQIAVSA